VASASLQAVKALASAFEVSIRALEYKESTMLSQLVGKEVLVVMGISMSRVSGFDDNLRGKIVEIEGEWLKLTQKNGNRLHQHRPYQADHSAVASRLHGHLWPT
jgi:hypothetical protein